jgi:translation initiation factor 2 subunit 1
MLYHRKGWPQDDDIVFCTVTKVLPNGVFADLDEYPGKSGLIHISEIAPGRIRNIRDYVSEGRKVVCKVIGVRAEKNQIDISLRRVNEIQKQQKLNSVKMEQKAELIINNVSKALKIELKKLYEDITKNLAEKYDYVYQCFDDIVAGNFDAKDLKLDKKIEAALVEVIKEKIKPPEVQISGTLAVQTFDPDGVELIKKTLTDLKSKNIAIAYLGGGKYKVTVTAPDYESAEDIVSKKINKAVELLKKSGSAVFDREKA